MIWNTRFCPTVNGPLHVGHLVTVLINEAEARASGGKFIVRFDDTQRSWNHSIGKNQVEEYLEGMKADLEWVGVRPDVYHRQSEMMDEVDDLLLHEFHYIPDRQWWSSDQGAEVAGWEHHVYPYTDRLTAEKVVMDVMGGVTWLIRGMDLITEDCLYRHYCAKFLINQPRMTYIPRVACGSSLSKTAGKYKIGDFRKAGMAPEELVNALMADCMIGVEWKVSGIQANPAIGSWADEALYGIC